LKLFILFNVLTLLISIHYLLLTFDTPMFATTLFYIVMWIASDVMLIWMRLYYGEIKWLDYDEDPTRKHFTTWLGGLAGVVVAASVVPRILEKVALTSVIYVPSPKRMMAQGMPLDLWSLASDMLFTLCLCALAEETMKVAAHTALYNSTKNEWLSAIIPIAIWGVIHGYVAYTGPLQLPLIAAAFAAGIIMFLALKRSRSLLLVVLVHGFFNILVILMTTFGV
jgi:membrane protease YdiL (CAAX protease family)